MLILLGSGAFSLTDLYRSQKTSRESYTSALHGMDVIGELQYQMQEARRTLLYALGTTDTNRQVEYADDSRFADQQVSRLLQQQEALVGSGEGVGARQRLAADWAVYLKVRDELISSILEGDSTAAVELDHRAGIPAFNQVRDDLVAMKHLFNADAERLLRQVDATATRSLLRLIGMLVTTLFAATVAFKSAQRNAALKAVQASEALLRKDLESISEELFALDSQGRVVLWNAVVERNWNRPRSNVIGLDVIEALPELAASPLRDAIEQALRNGRSAVLENLQLRRNEVSHYYQARVFPIQGGVSVFLNDITAQRNAEVARARLAAILEATPDFVGSADSRGRMFYVNRAAREMVGIPDGEDLSQLTIRDFYPAWAGEVVLNQGMTGAVREGVWRGETALLTRTGREIPLSQVVLAHKTADGSVDYFSTIGRDVSEAKQAETELRDSRQKFETLVNSVEGVVWEADMRTGALTFVSQRVEGVLGFPREKWTPAFWVERLHPEDRDWVPQFCLDGAAKGETFSFEYRMIAADGRAVWLRDYVNVVKEGDTPILLRGILIDITKQKEAEKELASLHQRLVEISRQMGMAEVATGVLHNVGNVLNSVNVSANLAADKIRGSKVVNVGKVAALLREHQSELAAYLTADPKGQQVPSYLVALAVHLASEQSAVLSELDSLRKNIDHMKEIVAMQQSYAKVSGVVETVPVTELVEDALRVNQAGLSRHQIEVVRDFDNVPPIPTDKHKVLQILVNVIRNAKYALDERGHSDKRLTMRVGSNGNRVKITISDNGVGIPPENLTVIFAHGFTTKRDGHGFGLHSAALAAKELGGSLTAHSDGVGQGATFTLELPLAAQAAEKKSA